MQLNIMIVQCLHEIHQSTTDNLQIICFVTLSGTYLVAGIPQPHILVYA